jgi:serine/threonine protein kinase
MTGFADGSTLADGRYTLERRLGTGGMAAVWLARDERLGRPVAIKALSDVLAGDEAYVRRFSREARVAAGLSHPNLVRVFDFGDEPSPYLVMEYVDGGTLAEHLREGRELDCDGLVRRLLEALEHVHDARIVHRDIKPANVLMGRDGRARLTDFGIAQPEDATQLTQTGGVMGTMRYLAPEVLHGEPATPVSDLYALGMLLRDCIGSEDGELGALAARLTAPEPAERPRSAAAALALLDAEPTEVTRVLSPAPREPRLRLGTRAAAAAGVLAVVILLLVAFSGGDGDAPPGLPPRDASLERQLDGLDQAVRALD